MLVLLLAACGQSQTLTSTPRPPTEIPTSTEVTVTATAAVTEAVSPMLEANPSVAEVTATATSQTSVALEETSTPTLDVEPTQGPVVVLGDGVIERNQTGLPDDQFPASSWTPSPSATFTPTPTVSPTPMPTTFSCCGATYSVMAGQTWVGSANQADGSIYGLKFEITWSDSQGHFVGSISFPFQNTIARIDGTVRCPNNRESSPYWGQIAGLTTAEDVVWLQFTSPAYRIQGDRIFLGAQYYAGITTDGALRGIWILTNPTFNGSYLLSPQ